MALTPPALAGERPRTRAFAYLTPAAAAVSDLHGRQCRWPVGEPADAHFAFCCGDTRRGGSYCAIHAKLAYPRASAGASP